MIISILVMSVIFNVQGNGINNYVIYMGNKFHFKQLNAFDLIIVKARKNVPVKRLQDQNKKVFAYMNLASLDLLDLENQGISSPSSLDIMFKEVDPAAQPRINYLLTKKIPKILWQGFDGLMLDGVPSLLHYASAIKKKSIRQDIIHLIKIIRLHYPGIQLLLHNGGEPILKEIYQYIDYYMASEQSIFYDHKESESRQYKGIKDYWQPILKYRQKNPALIFMALKLDYSPNTINFSKVILTYYQQQKILPYFTNHLLDQVANAPQ